MTAREPGQAPGAARREALRQALLAKIRDMYCSEPDANCADCGRIVDEILATVAEFGVQDDGLAEYDRARTSQTAFSIGMQAARDLAAQEQPAPEAFRLQLPPLTPEQIAAIRAELDEPGPHVPFPLDDAKPAPGSLALQLIIAVDALRDIADEPHAGYSPERATRALDDIGTPGFGTPRPAPLGTAWRLLDETRAKLAVSEAERDDLRQRLDERNAQHKALLDGFRSNGSGQVQRLSGTVLARMYRDAGYPVRDDLSHLEGK